MPKYKMPKKSCPLCGREIAITQIGRHMKACKGNKCSCGKAMFYRGLCLECVGKKLDRLEALEQENASLLAENTSLKHGRYLALHDESEALKSAELRVEMLEGALQDAIERMDRARNILRPAGTHNWGMLDTTSLKQTLEGSDPDV